jgi:hypothetical protein
MPMPRERSLDDWLDEDYNPYPHIPARNIGHLYKMEYHQWPKDDPTATQFYWHLYFRGEPVNGGLVDSEDHAKAACRQYKLTHQRQEFLRGFIWDSETLRWIPRAEYYM